MEPSTSGSGEIHSHLSNHPDKGEGMSGQFTSHTSPGERAREFAERAQDRADDFVETARGRTRNLRSRIGGAAHRVERLLDDAEDSLEARTGLMTSARDNPLAALGVAFAVGFLLAGTGDPERHPTVAKAKNQVKGAIMGGVSAAISQQLRTFIEEQGGVGQLLSSLGFPLGGVEEDSYATTDDDLRDL